MNAHSYTTVMPVRKVSLAPLGGDSASQPKTQDSNFAINEITGPTDDPPADSGYGDQPSREAAIGEATHHEIEAAADPEIEDELQQFKRAIQASLNYDGASFFCDNRRKKQELFKLAIPLYYELAKGGAKAYEFAVRQLPSSLRQRAPSRTKLELLSVTLTIAPQNIAQQKVCSNYANVIVAAHIMRLTGEEAISWATEASLVECVAIAKKARAAAKTSSRTLPEVSQDDTPELDSCTWLEINYGENNSIAQTLRANVNPAISQKIQEIISIYKPASRLGIVLRLLADEVDR